MSLCKKIANEFKFYFNLKGSHLTKGHPFLAFAVKKARHGFKL